MASKLTGELRGLPLDALEARESELREKLARLGMQRRARRLDKTADLGAAKKDLARVLTVLAHKRRAEAAQEDAS